MKSGSADRTGVFIPQHAHACSSHLHSVCGQIFRRITCTTETESTGKHVNVHRSGSSAHKCYMGRSSAAFTGRKTIKNLTKMVKEGFSGNYSLNYSTFIHNFNPLRYQIQWVQTFNTTKAAVKKTIRVFKQQGTGLVILLPLRGVLLDGECLLRLRDKLTSSLVVSSGNPPFVLHTDDNRKFNDITGTCND